MKFNDLDIEKWKELDINVDSLWLIGERDKSGKHANVYHGNFIPQIPNQLVRRYTKENEIVLDPFMGSGTTLFECEKLYRKFIGFDINNKIIDYVYNKMDGSLFRDYFIDKCDVTNNQELQKLLQNALKIMRKDKIRLNGFNTENTFNQNIRQDIKDYYKKQNCVMLGINGQQKIQKLK